MKQPSRLDGLDASDKHEELLSMFEELLITARALVSELETGGTTETTHDALVALDNARDYAKDLLKNMA
jgi:hypothetical protein